MVDATADTHGTTAPQGDDALRKPFVECAGNNGAYYADTFLSISKDQLPKTHIN